MALSIARISSALLRSEDNLSGNAGITSQRGDTAYVLPVRNTGTLIGDNVIRPTNPTGGKKSGVGGRHPDIPSDIPENILVSGTNGNERLEFNYNGTSWKGFSCYMYGLGGNDTLYGGNLNDFIDGGDGDDVIYGGEDLTPTSINQPTTRGSSIEKYEVSYLPTTSINLPSTRGGSVGNDDDYLNGGAGNDTLEGRWGNDTLCGGTGDDVLNGGFGNNEYIFSIGDGHDVIDIESGTVGYKFHYQSSRSTEETDTLVFTDASVTRESLTFSKLNNYSGFGSIYTDRFLVINYGNRGDRITVYLRRYDSEVIFGDFYTLSGINVRFANGSTVSLEDLLPYNTQGTSKTDNLYGSYGDDTLRGYGGDDLLYGREGNDVLWGGDGKDWLFGQDGNDKLYGEAGDDRMWGGGGNDVLDGGTGDDILNGGEGNDMLTGGAGNDLFVFDTALNATTNVDTITDFKHREDHIQLSKSIFSKLKNVKLATATLTKEVILSYRTDVQTREIEVLTNANFRASSNGNAADSDDYILYNTTTGALLYDADGSGSGAALQFATLQNKPQDVTASDFIVEV